jgi:predicted ester cyclase
MEHDWSGTVPGEFLGIPGNGKSISFRLLHIWEFKNGLISRENVWLDSGAIIQQLTEPEHAGAVA